MRKGRFWYLLISSILVLSVITFTFIHPTIYDIYIYIACILAYIPNFTFRKSEKDQLFKIVSEYALNCDANQYYVNIRDFYNSLYLTKLGRKIASINLATIKIEMGELEESEKMLLEIKDIIDKTTLLNKYSYYRAWCSIYYEKGEANHYQILLNEMREIVDNEKNPSIKEQLSQNFRHVEAKYFIMNGIYLDKARAYYDEILSMSSPLMLRLSANYYLGVIYAKENNREKALEHFKKVAFSDKRLYLVTKAISYVNALEK